MLETEIITLILRPEILEGTLSLLGSMGVEPISVANVEGVGRQRGHSEIYRGGEYEIQTLPKVRLDLVVMDPLERDEVIQKVSSHVRTGRVGDGKIFVFRGTVPPRVETGAELVS